MSDLIGGMQQAADVLADASIEAFWRQYDTRMSAAVQEAGLRISPEVRVKSLLVRIFQQSVQSGWIDINTYSYQQFVHADLLSIPEILDFVAEVAAEQGVLTTQDIELANELYRQIRQRQWTKQRRHWWQIF